MNKNILMLFLCTWVFFACTNEENLLSPTEQGSLPDVSVRNGMLAFKDPATYEAFEDKLNRSNTSEKIAFLDSIGFKSQLYLLNEADQELETLCSTDDRNTFNRTYQSFKDKYGTLFMFNDIDTTDLSPYYRLERSELSVFANTDGEFMIGDSLVKCSNVNSFSDYYANTSYSSASEVSLRAEPEPVNTILVKDGDRKVGMHLSKTNSIVYANFTSQKKTFVGWVRYNTIYNYRVTISMGIFYHLNYIASNGNETLIPLNPGQSVQCLGNREMSGNETLKIGEAISTVIGRYEAWSRGVLFEKRGSAIMAL